MKKKTTEEFISELKQIHGNNYDYSKVAYNGANQHVTLICPKHGEFTIQPAELLHGRSCPKCAADKKRKGQDDRSLVISCCRIMLFKFVISLI